MNCENMAFLKCKLEEHVSCTILHIRECMHVQLQESNFKTKTKMET